MPQLGHFGKNFLKIKKIAHDCSHIPFTSTYNTSLPHTQTLLILQLYSFSEIVIILVLLVSHIKKVLPRGKCLKEGRKDMKVGLHPFTNYCYCSQVLKKHIDLTTIGSGFVQV